MYLVKKTVYTQVKKFSMQCKVITPSFHLRSVLKTADKVTVERVKK